MRKRLREPATRTEEDVILGISTFTNTLQTVNCLSYPLKTLVCAKLYKTKCIKFHLTLFWDTKEDKKYKFSLFSLSLLRNTSGNSQFTETEDDTLSEVNNHMKRLSY